MTNCRCAKCRRREIRDATGMTLSLAWNKVLNSSCYSERVIKSAEWDKAENPVLQEKPPAIKEAS